MPSITGKPKLQVRANVWALGKEYTHKGAIHKAANYEECRAQAKALGYSGIRIIYV